MEMKHVEDLVIMGKKDLLGPARLSTRRISLDEMNGIGRGKCHKNQLG
jgi:hypothetical protein